MRIQPMSLRTWEAYQMRPAQAWRRLRIAGRRSYRRGGFAFQNTGRPSETSSSKYADGTES